MLLLINMCNLESGFNFYSGNIIQVVERTEQDLKPQGLDFYFS